MSSDTSELIRQDDVTIRFAGDSGDGMQLTGTQFTDTTAKVGNDLATFPDFPAEIRAPAGTRRRVGLPDPSVRRTSTRRAMRPTCSWR
jgi:Pyruvate/2-oxoacid:ferredoxin oxidoreductase gamma subunit